MRFVFLCSFPTRRSSDLEQLCLTLTDANSFITEEEKGMVFDDGSTEDTTKLVEPKRRLCGVEVVFRIEYVVTHVFIDRKSTRLNSSHRCISYAVFCLKKK